MNIEVFMWILYLCLTIKSIDNPTCLGDDIIDSTGGPLPPLRGSIVGRWFAALEKQVSPANARHPNICFQLSPN